MIREIISRDPTFSSTYEDKSSTCLSDISSIQVSDRELLGVLKNSNKNSAAGHDRVNYKLIDELCKNRPIRDAIKSTFYIWFASGFPDSMKRAKIIPIAKGKTEAVITKNVRNGRHRF